MSASLKAAAALLSLAALLPTNAHADPRSVPSGGTATELVRNFWDLVASRQGEDAASRPQPQAIRPAPAGTPSSRSE